MSSFTGLNVTTGATSGSGTASPSGIHLWFLVGLVLLNLKKDNYALLEGICAFVTNSSGTLYQPR